MEDVEVRKYEVLRSEGYKAGDRLREALEHLITLSEGLGYHIPVEAYKASIAVLLKEVDTLTSEADSRLTKLRRDKSK